jgi:hypothetical protein
MYFNISKFSFEQPNFLVFTWCGEFHFSFATLVVTFKNKLPTSVLEVLKSMVQIITINVPAV